MADLDALLCGAFVSGHAEQAARHLERLPVVECLALLEATEARVAAGVLERMAPLDRANCAGAMTPERFGALLAHLKLDTAAAVLRRMDAAPRRDVLAAAPSGTRDHLERLLAYPGGSAGALMEARAWSAPQDHEVGDVLPTARRVPPEVAAHVYCVDREGRLVGVVELVTLLRSEPRATLASVMHSDVVKVRASASGQALLEHPGWRDHRVLPVVDERDRLLGALRQRTLPPGGGSSVERGRAPAAAFAELYWIGVSGLLSGLASVFTGPTSMEGWENEP